MEVLNVKQKIVNAIAVGVVSAAFLAAGPVHATPGWSNSLTAWNVSLDNGVIYVNASNMPTNCLNARAQISTSATLSGSTSYSSELYSFILASSAAQLPLKVAIEPGESTCKVYGAKNE